MAPLSTPTTRFAPAPTQFTTFRNATVAPLLNGVRYKATLAAISSQLGAGQAASVEFIPRPPCAPVSTDVQPPSNLTAQAGDGRVELCWGPPMAGACATEYRIISTLLEQGAGAAASLRPRRTTEPGCLTVTRLRNGAAYQFAVQVRTACSSAFWPALLG